MPEISTEQPATAEPSPQPPEPAAPSGETGESTAVQHAGAEEVPAELVERAEEMIERVGDALKKPAIGAAVAGGVVLAAAGMWGASEAAVGALAAYGVYRLLRRRRRERAAA